MLNCLWLVDPQNGSLTRYRGMINSWWEGMGVCAIGDCSEFQLHSSRNGNHLTMMPSSPLPPSLETSWQAAMIGSPAFLYSSPGAAAAAAVADVPPRASSIGSINADSVDFKDSSSQRIPALASDVVVDSRRRVLVPAPSPLASAGHCACVDIGAPLYTKRLFGFDVVLQYASGIDSLRLSELQIDDAAVPAAAAAASSSGHPGGHATKLLALRVKAHLDSLSVRLRIDQCFGPRELIRHRCSKLFHSVARSPAGGVTVWLRVEAECSSKEEDRRARPGGDSSPRILRLTNASASLSKVALDERLPFGLHWQLADITSAVKEFLDGILGTYLAPGGDDDSGGGGGKPVIFWGGHNASLPQILNKMLSDNYPSGFTCDSSRLPS
eukprot:GHVU01193423.1.p1 GENE.GHVU01193423.1~~GHVU01193423.1.p1  ORF type:complete len:383 (+),score=75.07 GHVU01193423.1:1003-2151(+)